MGRRLPSGQLPNFESKGNQNERALKNPWSQTRTPRARTFAESKKGWTDLFLLPGSLVANSAYRYWKLDPIDDIARLTLEKPAESNSLDESVLGELQSIAELDFGTLGIRALILEGAGRHFSVGMDLSVIERLAQLTAAEFRKEMAGMQTALDAFDRVSIPVVAAIRGFCIGGGLLLAACADLRVASERSYFSMPEVRMGFGISLGMHRLLRLVPPSVASELVLLGERLDAERALALGLITHICQPGDLESEALRLAHHLSRLPAEGVRLNKLLLRNAQVLSAEDSQVREIEEQVAGLGDERLLEPLRAYARQIRQ